LNNVYSQKLNQIDSDYNSNNPGNNALSFDGVDDYVEIPYDESLAPKNFTVELWAKSSTEFWNSHGSLLSFRDVYILHPFFDGKSFQFFVFDNGYSQYVEYKIFKDITEWHHYAGTYNGKQLKLYIDGKLVASGKNPIDKSAGKIGNLFIGCDSKYPERYFHGVIDEVRIWNYAKTETNIQYSCNAKLFGNEKGLVAYYNFNQGNNNDDNTNENILYDITGNHDGTLYNFNLSGDSSNWVSSEVIIINKGRLNNVLYNIFTIRNIMILISVILIVFLLFFVKIRRQKKIQKLLEKEVALKTKELVKENKIKDALISEIHHRVKNNLQTISSLIYFQLKTIPKQENKQGLMSIQQRVNSMAAIHEMLYSSGDNSNVSLERFITDFISYIKTMIYEYIENLEIEYIIENIQVDISKAITLGLMISEIITNSIKYAFENTPKPRIIINIYKLEDEIIFSIKDNGCGIDEEMIKNNKKSIGFKIIDIFSRQLDAKMSIFNNDGLEYKFSFMKLKS